MRIMAVMALAIVALVASMLVPDASVSVAHAVTAGGAFALFGMAFDKNTTYTYRGRTYGPGLPLTVEDLDAEFDEEHAPRTASQRRASRIGNEQKATPRRPGEGEPSGIIDSEDIPPSEQQVGAGPLEGDLEDKTLPELKEAARQRGLDVKGEDGGRPNKADYVRALSGGE